MSEDDATIAVIDALESLAIPYMLVGSLSSNFYGIPRATQDADFVIHLQASSIAALGRHLGSGFHLDPQISFETATMTRRHLIQVQGSEFKIELFLLSDDPHDQLRFQRRRRLEFLDRQTWIPTAEDVVIMKLRWAVEGQRSKDLDDVRNVIAVQGDRIDWEYVYPWCDQHGTRRQLDEIRQSLQDL